ATVEVTVTGETALFRFSARIGDVRPDSSKPEQCHLTLPRPLCLARIQRRQHVRVAMPIPATFEPASDFAQEAGQPVEAGRAEAEAHLPMHGVVLDLSGGGLRAEVGRAMGAKEAAQLVDSFVPGTVMRIRLPLPALSDVKLLARVRICERAAVRGGLG